jgi:ProP effector
MAPASRRSSKLRIEIEKRAQLMRRTLVKRWPLCFVPAGTDPKPLKTGIFADVVAEAPFLGGHDLINAITAYCNDPAYHRAVLAGTNRVDLNGENVGEISDDARQYARRRLPKAVQS